MSHSRPAPNAFARIGTIKRAAAVALGVACVAPGVPSALAYDRARELLVFEDIPSVITATKISQRVTETPASAVVITAGQLKRMGTRTLADALKTVPGVYISRSERHLLRIHIRGIGNSISSYNDKVLLLIDGTPQRELVYGHAFIDEYLPVENILRIEVIKGPGSALYGTNAFAGVINVITKSAGDLQGTQVTAGIGSRQTKTASILSGEVTGDSSVTVFGRTYTTQGDGPEFSSRSKRQTLQEDPARADSYWLKTSFGDLAFDAKYLEYHHKFPTNWDIPADAWDRNWFNYRNLLLDANYQKTLSDSLSVMARAWWQNYDNDSFYMVTEAAPPYAATQYVYPIKKSQILGVQAEATLSFPRHSIVAGAELDYEKIDEVFDHYYDAVTGVEILPSDFWMDPVDNTNYAFYAQDIVRATDWLDVTLGVRQDQHDVFGGFTSPRGGLVFHPGSRIVFKLLYGEAYRAPSYRDLYIMWRNEPEGSENLQPEEIRTAEAEINYALTGSLRTQLNYYHNRVKNMIGMRNWVWTNLSGEAKIQGVEYQLEYLAGGNRSFFNYSWTDAKDDSGDTIPDIPVHMANLGIDIALSPVLSVSPLVNWVGHRPRRADDTNSRGWDTRYPRGTGRADIDGYVTVDLPILYRAGSALDIGLTVYNVFDARSYDPGEDTRYRDFERAGRNYLMTATYHF